MRVTPRDLQLLAALARGRWLTTSQVAALCFSEVHIEMARRRLRLLEAAGYVFSRQANHMTETLHTLAPGGKQLLASRGWSQDIRLERIPPKNLDHFRGINDIRVAVDRSTRANGIALSFFYACWELQQRGWQYPLIPDAACQISDGQSDLTVLFEYDRGEESPGYVTRTKFLPYVQGLDGFAFSGVVIVADTRHRLEQLRRYALTAADAGLFLFMLRETLLGSWNISEWFS